MWGQRTTKCEIRISYFKVVVLWIFYPKDIFSFLNRSTRKISKYESLSLQFAVWRPGVRCEFDASWIRNIYDSDWGYIIDDGPWNYKDLKIT